MNLKRTVVQGEKRLLAAMRSSKSETVHDLPVQHGDFESLRESAHCLVVTYRKDGQPVAQPIWPGFDGDRMYVWSEADAYKAKRLRRNPAALIAACDFRGIPKGQPIAAAGRILESEEERTHAERVLQSQWGPGRRAFMALSRPLTEMVYMEFVPAKQPTAE